MQLYAFLAIIMYCNYYCDAKYDGLRKRLQMGVFTANPKQSMVVSPLLVRFPLCKLATVATGTSKNELMSILGFKSNCMNCFSSLKNVITPLKELDILLLNKIFLNYTDDINPNFVANGSDYGLRVDKVGFNYPSMAAVFINRWVDRATYKRITDIVNPADINNRTSILIVSAAYFKATWEFPFDMRLTKNMKFRHHNGNVSLVPMMTKVETYLFMNDDASNIQYVNMKMASFGLSMTLVVPRSFIDLTQFLNKMSTNENYLQGIYKQMTYETVEVKFPRFKIKTTVDWNKYLNKIGLTQIFNETHSGLNGILKKNSSIKNIYLSKMKQKIYIDVDEMGVFRRPPTDDLLRNDHNMKRSSISMKIIADHPFYFTINLQPDMSRPLDLYELFSGIYHGPNY